MTEKVLTHMSEIEKKIYTIRGVQVMLDKDLAKLYGVKSIRLREQVKRNKKRFPPDFMFQLTEKEVAWMVSHFAIPSKKNLGGFLPQAVAKLPSVAKVQQDFLPGTDSPQKYQAQDTFLV